MEEFVKKYGTLIISGVITIAIVTFLYNSGLNLALSKSLGITPKSNDNANTMETSASAQVMRSVAERKLPDVIGKKLYTDTEYYISYEDGAGEQSNKEYLLQTKDADGNMDTSCFVSIRQITNDKGDILYDADVMQQDSTVIIGQNTVKFCAPGAYRIKVEITDQKGTNQISTVVANVNNP